MKHILIILLLVSGCFTLQAQTLPQEADIRQIYETTLQAFKIHPHTDQGSVVSPITSKRELKNFRIRDPLSHSFAPRRFKLQEDPVWRAFLLSVDTALVQNYPLQTGQEYWFGKPPKPKEARRYAILSPVIFSEDKKRAIFILEQNTSANVVFLEKRESGEWEIVENLFLWYS